MEIIVSPCIVLLVLLFIAPLLLSHLAYFIHPNFLWAGLTILLFVSILTPTYSSSLFGCMYPNSARWRRHTTRKDHLIHQIKSSTLHDTRRQDIKRATLIKWATTRLTNRVYECLRRKLNPSYIIIDQRLSCVYIATRSIPSTPQYHVGRMLWCELVCFHCVASSSPHTTLLICISSRIMSGTM